MRDAPPLVRQWTLLRALSTRRNGMTVREIQSHLQEMYGTEVSAGLISSVTDAVADEVKSWQSRPLDEVYPIVYLDCIHAKVRDGAVRVKAVYLALGVNMAGEKGIPVINITQILDLAKENGLPISPEPLPEPPSGGIFYRQQYNLYTVTISLMIYLGLLLFVITRKRGR